MTEIDLEIINFNPRSREGSDRDGVPVPYIPLSFQSTLPRGERQNKFVVLFKTVKISIHAPARGATVFFGIHKRYQKISIHAPARGATATLILNPEKSLYFNPRSREGSDIALLFSTRRGLRFQSTLPRGERHFLSNMSLAKFCISIHAPARGATRGSHDHREKGGFQSTLPRGERQSFTLMMRPP